MILDVPRCSSMFLGISWYFSMLHDASNTCTSLHERMITIYAQKESFKCFLTTRRATISPISITEKRFHHNRADQLTRQDSALPIFVCTKFEMKGHGNAMQTRLVCVLTIYNEVSSVYVRV